VKKFTGFFPEDRMIPETYIYTVVSMIKGLSQMLELYPKYVKRSKNEEVLIKRVFFGISL